MMMMGCGACVTGLPSEGLLCAACIMKDYDCLPRCLALAVRCAVCLCAACVRMCHTRNATI